MSLSASRELHFCCEHPLSILFVILQAGKYSQARNTPVPASVVNTKVMTRPLIGMADIPDLWQHMPAACTACLVAPQVLLRLVHLVQNKCGLHMCSSLYRTVSYFSP